jgi:NIMA (never in mitosis gene a)-related kinase
MSIKDFQIVNKLGEGAYSSVYKVKRNSDGLEYALKKVKLMNLSEKEKQNALNEVRILASLRHPNMIAYKEAFLEEASNSLCIVMEYCNNGDLFQRIVEHQKKGTLFPEVDIWNFFIQMVKALKALHDMKIFHRDLKSANVFLNKDGTAKLGDLNVSKVAKKGLLYTQTGTPYYASPEVWRDQPYDSKSDIWSLGCVLYEMTTLKPPFRAEDMEGLYKKVLRGYYPRIPSHYSQDLNNIIRCLLQVSPHLRPSCDKLLQMPAVIKRIDEKHLMEFDDNTKNDLLTTIRIPKNLHYLTERLPKANYVPMKTKKIDKHKFLQTLAGYKDISPNVSGLDEGLFKQGSESVDSHKKYFKDGGVKNLGNIHLPPLHANGIPHRNNEDIVKIYTSKDGGKKAVPISKNDLLEKNILNLDAELKRALEMKKLKEKEREREKEAAQREREHREPREPREHREREKSRERERGKDEVHHSPGYSIKDLNKEFVYDKHISNIQNIYGTKPHKKSPELSPVKGHHALGSDQGSGHLKLKKAMSPEYSNGEEVDDHGRLPPLKGEAKASKLPALRNRENGDAQSPIPSVAPNKGKLKELSKLYKVNIGNIDDLNERYQQLGSKPVAKRDRQKENYMVKNQSTQGNGNADSYLDNAVSGVKYSKHLNKDDEE